MKQAILKTEQQIFFVKETFQSALSEQLNLTRISSPIAIRQGTGINDDLNGIERTVGFPVKSLGDDKAVVVNSLAKWKRVKLQELEIDEGQGIIADMRALRPDEDYSPIHSIYVDQWDWEKRISAKDRNLSLLKTEVKKIFKALKKTESLVASAYGDIKPILPDEITFIHSEKLIEEYPDLTPKERESAITEKYGAVFLMGIGGLLSDGKRHDGRAPDYDDWSSANEDGFKGLNGDILFWHPILKQSFEMSSMGIRVDRKAMLHQLEITDQVGRKELSFHKMVLADKVPQSIGGGIGQSRTCMYFLRKQHIGEVQVGIWPEAVKEKLSAENVVLL